MVEADPLEVACWRMANGELRSEDLPELATDALVRGLDTPSLRVLAGQNPADVRDSADLFLRALDELGVSRPTQDEAAWSPLLAARMPNLQTKLLVITAAYTGMRFGELAGLSRNHVHLDRALIHVAALSGALHEVSGDRWLGPPKTKAAVRDVRLPPFLVDGLELLLQAHPYEVGP